VSQTKYRTAGELSLELPFSEQYIRAAMNHPDFKTIGRHPAFSTLDDAVAFFESNPQFTIRSVYKRKEKAIRVL